MKRYALLGYGVSYTRSPEIHAAISRVTGRACTYDVVDVKENELGAAVARLNANYDGYNITKPYKERVATAARADEARVIGAINTVRTADGMGFNTDYDGFVAALRRKGMLPKNGARVLILGAGGAARSAIYALRHTSLTVANRTVERARAVVDALGVSATVVSTADVTGSFALVVNCTTQGLHGEQSLPPRVALCNVGACYDMIYEPARTPFLQAAQAQGIAVENGLSMLVLQAVRARELWEGVTITPDERERILQEVTV